MVRQLCGDLAFASLRYLVKTGFLSKAVMSGAFYVAVDASKLEKPKFAAGASIDPAGRPFIAIRPGLNAGRPDLIAQVIAHESIHLAQIIKGDLDPRKGYSLWKGERHKNLSGDDSAYFEDQPWESEAQALEGEVLAHLMTLLDLSND